MLASPRRIQLLGALQARQDSQTLSRFRTEKTAALLGYLALHIGVRQPREQLVEMFSPERQPESGRLNLRVALASLRRQLEPPGIPAGTVLTSTHESISLNRASAQTDVELFASAVRRAQAVRTPEQRYALFEAAATLYTGPFLSGFYYDWVLTERSRLQDVYTGVLDELLDSAEERGARGSLWSTRTLRRL